MKTKPFLNANALFCLSIFLTSTTLFAFTEVEPKSQDAYQKIERQYVISKSQSVKALCESGDTLIKGYCYGENRLEVADAAEHGVFLDSKELKTDGKSGWECSPKIIHHEQVIRLESIVLCKRAQAKT